MTVPTHHLSAVARAMVAEPVWRWMPGMLIEGPEGPCRIVEASPSTGKLQVVIEHLGGQALVGIRDDAHMVPDLADPATLGCILALCREASRTPTLYALPQSWRGQVAWRVASARITAGGEHPSEAAALLAALRLCPSPAPPPETP